MPSLTERVPGAQSGALVIMAEWRGRHAVLQPHGEIVHGATAVLREVLAQVPTDISTMVLDMVEVTFMDSAGLHFLERTAHYGCRHRIRVESVNWTGQPRRVLELSGFEAGDRDGLGARAERQALPRRPLEPPAPSAVSLEREERMGELLDEVRQLHQAIDSRPLIDQARGVLMATYGCSAQEAWDVLLDVSQHTNIKLRLIATAVISSTNGQAPTDEVRAALRGALARIC